MAWTISGVRIYVQEYGGDEEALIARLNPRGGGTILHWFGYSDPVVQIEALVLTQSDLDTLKTMKQGNTAYTIVSPEGGLGDWYVKKVGWSRESSTDHVFFDRPGVARDVPLYRVTLEVYPDV